MNKSMLTIAWKRCELFLLHCILKICAFAKCSNSFLLQYQWSFIKVILFNSLSSEYNISLADLGVFLVRIVRTCAAKINTRAGKYLTVSDSVCIIVWLISSFCRIELGLATARKIIFLSACEATEPAEVCLKLNTNHNYL